MGRGGEGNDEREGNDFQVFSLGVIPEGPGRVSLGESRAGELGEMVVSVWDLVSGRGPLYTQKEFSKGNWQSDLYNGLR